MESNITQRSPDVFQILFGDYVNELIKLGESNFHGCFTKIFAETLNDIPGTR